MIIEEDVRPKGAKDTGLAVATHEVGFISWRTPRPQRVHDTLMGRSVSSRDDAYPHTARSIFA